MVFYDGVKFACLSCIRGHRSSNCNHVERPLLEVRKKGRPVSQCAYCRDLRKTRQIHAKCACSSKNKGNSHLLTTTQNNNNNTDEYHQLAHVSMPAAAADKCTCTEKAKVVHLPKDQQECCAVTITKKRPSPVASDVDDDEHYHKRRQRSNAKEYAHVNQSSSSSPPSSCGQQQQQQQQLSLAITDCNVALDELSLDPTSFALSLLLLQQQQQQQEVYGFAVPPSLSSSSTTAAAATTALVDCCDSLLQQQQQQQPSPSEFAVSTCSSSSCSNNTSNNSSSPPPFYPQQQQQQQSLCGSLMPQHTCAPAASGTAARTQGESVMLTITPLSTTSSASTRSRIVTCYCGDTCTCPGCFVHPRQEWFAAQALPSSTTSSCYNGSSDDEYHS